MNAQETIRQYLLSEDLDFEVLSHEPFFSADEGEEFCAAHEIAIPKNLVMTNKQKNRFWMVTVRGNKKVSLNQLKKQLQVTGPKFSFADPVYLESLLKVTPGSVSPFGLMFDTEHQVNFYLDEAFKDDEYFGFHPNINTETWRLSQSHFMHFLRSLKREPQWISIPTVE